MLFTQTFRFNYAVKSPNHMSDRAVNIIKYHVGFIMVHQNKLNLYRLSFDFDFQVCRFFTTGTFL